MFEATVEPRKKYIGIHILHFEASLVGLKKPRILNSDWRKAGISKEVSLRVISIRLELKLFSRHDERTIPYLDY